MKIVKSALEMTALNISYKSSDAYSASRYKDWDFVALTLLKMGFNELEAEAIMRSKWTRWAADNHSAKYGKVPAKAIKDFIKSMNPEELKVEVQKLVAGTFAP